MSLFVATLAAVLVAVATQPQSKTGCKCVHYTLCNLTTLEIITDGSDLLGERVDAYEDCSCPGPANEFGGECGGKLMCCHAPGQTPIITTTEEPEEEEETWDDCGIKGFRPGVTGVRVIAAADKGVTFPNEFPWMALIVNKTDESMVCGASILDHHVVMTAAHCVRRFQVDELLVRAGVWNKDDLTGTQNSPVERIIKHEQFGPNNYRNDIALLVLKQGLQLSHNVAPICQPQPNINFDNMKCIATGWGTSQFGTRNYSSILKKVDLTIVPHAQCQSELRKTRLGPWFRLHDSFVCAKGEDGVDTCTGDGGGPLICRPAGSDKYVQVGIIAAGVECGNNVPALYANVPRLEPWIQQKFISGNFRNFQ